MALAPLLFNCHNCMLYLLCRKLNYLHSGKKVVVVSLKYVDHSWLNNKKVLEKKYIYIFCCGVTFLCLTFYCYKLCLFESTLNYLHIDI